MDSLDAQCLLVHLTSSADPPACPTTWLHPNDGSLEATFAGGSRSFRWTPEDVASLAARWRGLALELPPGLLKLVPGHRAFAAMLRTGDVPAPDRIEHDLRSEELTAFYDEAKLAVVVGDDPDDPWDPAGA